MRIWQNAIFCPKKVIRKITRQGNYILAIFFVLMIMIFLTINSNSSQQRFTDQNKDDIILNIDHDKHFDELSDKPANNPPLQDITSINFGTKKIKNKEETTAANRLKSSPTEPPKKTSTALKTSSAKVAGSSEHRELNSIKDKNYSSKKYKKKKRKCPEEPKNLIGNFSVDATIKPSFKDIEALVGSELKQGGCFRPPCKSLQKVAIIIPFKNRDSHLKTLLYYLHPLLMRQLSYYCVFVAEQYDNGQFNKAMIMNAAYRSVMVIDDFDCIVFHDVDMLPEDDRNLYRCGKEPRHLSPAIDKFNYKPHYGTEFGGVTAITPAQYEKVNGHSNRFWGWGGEDNDIEYRIKRKKMKIEASPLAIGRYKMIRHRASWQFTKSSYRYALNNTWEKRADVDGLSNLRFRSLGAEKHSTFTKLHLDIRRIEVKKLTLIIDEVPSMDIDVKSEKCRWESYKEKYLDFDVPVLMEDYEKLKRLKPNESLFIPPPPPPPPNQENDVESKEDEKNKPTKQVPVATLTTLDEAEKMCEALSPECRGITVESKKTYKLRRSGVPRNYIFRYDDGDDYAHAKYAFPVRDSYVKYCPGTFGYVQRYNKSLLVEAVDLFANGWHSYQFVMEFTVLIPPEKPLRFLGQPIFEAQLHKQIDFGKFELSSSHYKFGQRPKPNIPNETYTYKTRSYILPNIPGTYIMECKIIDSHNTPHRQWNWYFEVSTNDKELDTKVRDKFAAEDKKAKLAQAAKTQRKLEEKLKKTAKHSKEESKPLTKKQFSYVVIADDPDDQNKRALVEIKSRRVKLHQ